MNPRLRNLLLTGGCLVAVGGIATVWATGSMAASARYNTAVAAIGEVAQSYQATGTISRSNVVDAEFSENGTVKKIHVAIGDAVEKGDVLATLDTTALKLALLNAETELAGAKANLYAAEHPSAGSSGVPSSGVPSGGSGSGGSGSGNGGSVPGGISAADAAKLYQAIAAVNVATQKWSNPEQPTTCDAIYTALLNANTDDPEPTPTPTPTPEPTPTPTPEPTPTPTPEPTPTQTTAPVEATTGPTTTATAEPTADGGDVEPLALVVEDITIEDIRACGQARTDLLMANAVLADYYQQLIATGTIDDGTGNPGGGSPGGGTGNGSTGGSVTIPSGGSKSGSAGSSPKASARSVASAEAEVLKATRAVQSAEAALNNAELVAPLSGTVGALSLSVGDNAAAGTVTIVGEGTATVTLEVPLATRTLLSQGMPAIVTPAGSLDSLPGTIGSISILETEGTAGDNPTYTTEVVVEDPDMLLKEGARAGVEITTRTATGVVTIPVSAVTPTGTGTATVQIVDNATAETARVVEVTTGAVGNGRIEITAGLEEGQIVVLSDKTAPLPAGNLAQARRDTTGGR